MTVALLNVARYKEPCHRLNRPISVIVMFRIAIYGELYKLDVGPMANSVVILMCLTTELNGLTLSVHYVIESHVVVYVTYVQYILDSKSYRFTITTYSVTNQRYFYSTQGRRIAAPLRGAGINVHIVIYCTNTVFVAVWILHSGVPCVKIRGQYSVTTNPGLPDGYSESWLYYNESKPIKCFITGLPILWHACPK